MSAAEPERVLALLWRHHVAGRAKPGPVPSLSTDRVVEAAVAKADADGLQTVTMRELGRELQAPAMTLYTHVQSRAVLTELMIDWVYGTMDRERPSNARWEDKVWSIARDNRRLYATHPWIVEVATSRSVLGPGALGKYEFELAAFERAHLTDLQTDLALTMLLGVVEHSARMEMARLRLESDSGLTEAQWWARAGPVLAEAYEPQDYPLSTRIGAAAGQALGGSASAEHSFNFGVARVIASIAALQ